MPSPPSIPSSKKSKNRERRLIGNLPLRNRHGENVDAQIFNTARNKYEVTWTELQYFVGGLWARLSDHSRPGGAFENVGPGFILENPRWIWVTRTLTRSGLRSLILSSLFDKELRELVLDG